MLVIDARSREVATYVANVTRAEAGLVVRKAIELPSLFRLAQGRGWDNPFPTDMPVLVIGQGYQARSSCGFVTVQYGTKVEVWHRIEDDAELHIAVVAMQGDDDRPLRMVRPVEAAVFKCARLIADKVMGNSNCQTADAVSAGVKLLLAADPRAVAIQEGQSDRARVVRLLPDDPKAERLAAFPLEEIEEEHRADRFTAEEVVRSMLAYLVKRYEEDYEGGYARECAERALRERLEIGEPGSPISEVRQRPRGGRRAFKSLRAAYATLPTTKEAEVSSSASTDPVEALSDWEEELRQKELLSAEPSA